MTVTFPQLFKCSPVTSKGGLMFTEAVSNQAMYLNPNTFTVTRQADTSILNSGTQYSRDITMSHHLHCQHINNIINDYNVYRNFTASTTTTPPPHRLAPTTEFIIAPLRNTLFHASSVCKTINARNPEIRTVAQRENLRQIAIDNNITLIYSGITFDPTGPIYKFRSNNEDAMTSSTFGKLITYGGDYVHYLDRVYICKRPLHIYI